MNMIITYFSDLLYSDDDMQGPKLLKLALPRLIPYLSGIMGN